MKLIFLHYFGGSARSWDDGIAQLTPDFDCLPLDVPGFGDAPPLSAHQNVDDMADALRPAIDAFVGSDPFLLIGHSMGGKVALALAAGTSTRPAPTSPSGRYLRGLVLVAPSPPVPEPIPDEVRQQMLAKPSQTREQQRKAAEKTAQTITKLPLSETAWQRIIADNLRASTEAWVAWPNVGSRDDISARMSRINVPVSILAGDHDDALDLSVQPDLVMPYLPQATLQVVRGGGHLLPLEAPDEVARVIREMGKQVL